MIDALKSEILAGIPEFIKSRKKNELEIVKWR